MATRRPNEPQLHNVQKIGRIGHLLKFRSFGYSAYQAAAASVLSQPISEVLGLTVLRWVPRTLQAYRESPVSSALISDSIRRTFANASTIRISLLHTGR